MRKTVVIIGAGGHGKVVADIILRSGDTVLGFLDDNPHLPATIAGIPVLGTISDYSKFSDAAFVIAIGNNTIRQKLASQLTGVVWYTAIHPRAVVSPMDTHIGEGTVIMATAAINPGATVGRHCIINTSAVVEHDNRLGDFVHLSVGAKLGGTVTVGNNSVIGINSTVINNVTVSCDSIIGAGSVVLRDLPTPGTYVGIPAKQLNQL